jgi:hypothetical protein
MTRRHVVMIALLALVLAVVVRGERLLALGSAGTPEVAVAYDPAEVASNPKLRAAWDASFAERSVPHVWIAESDLAGLTANRLSRRYPAVVMPDGLTRWVPDGLAAELLAYTTQGGTLLVVADAGTRTDDGRVLAEPVFGDLTGANTANDHLVYVAGSAASLLVSGHPETMHEAVGRASAILTAARRVAVAGR